MRILTISTVFPCPPHDGGNLLIYNRVRNLSRSNDLLLLCVIERNPDETHIRV